MAKFCRRPRHQAKLVKAKDAKIDPIMNRVEIRDPVGVAMGNRRVGKLKFVSTFAPGQCVIAKPPKRRSLPDPPATRSAPEPPNSRSLPNPPAKVSLPKGPRI